MHDGKMQDHSRSTTTVTIAGAAGTPSVIDSWTDPDAPASSQDSDYSKSTVKLTEAGTETITVPAGTFSCKKYTATMDDGSTATFWASSSVPVPVKYTTVSSSGATGTTQLVDYSK